MFTKEEILDGNKIICEFLGGEVTSAWKIHGVDTLCWRGDEAKEFRHKFIVNIGEAILLDQCKFNYDWNWLIPVVEKIESIKDKLHGHFGVYISANSCTIQATKLRTIVDGFYPAYFNDITLENKISATYYAILMFIKWYDNGNYDKTELSKYL